MSNKLDVKQECLEVLECRIGSAIKVLVDAETLIQKVKDYKGFNEPEAPTEPVNQCCSAPQTHQPELTLLEILQTPHGQAWVKDPVASAMRKIIPQARFEEAAKDMHRFMTTGERSQSIMDDMCVMFNDVLDAADAIRANQKSSQCCDEQNVCEDNEDVVIREISHDDLPPSIKQVLDKLTRN